MTSTSTSIIISIAVIVVVIVLIIIVVFIIRIGSFPPPLPVLLPIYCRPPVVLLPFCCPLVVFIGTTLKGLTSRYCCLLLNVESHSWETTSRWSLHIEDFWEQSTAYNNVVSSQHYTTHYTACLACQLAPAMPPLPMPPKGPKAVAKSLERVRKGAWMHGYLLPYRQQKRGHD